MTDRTMEVNEGSACGSSKSVTIFINSPNECQGAGNKTKHTVQINLTATGKDLRARVSDLVKIEQECIELIYCGRNLDMEKPLSEQKIVDKARVRVKKIDMKAREEERCLSRIKKGADLLVQRGQWSGENFEKTYLKITNEKLEVVEVPEKERVAILTALVLHETARDYMKPEKQDWTRALKFLKFAEEAFGECNQDYIKYIDNNGVLNLDVLWCYMKLEKQPSLEEANKRLENAEMYLKNTFEKNTESDQEHEENSVRKKILFLQVHILWGVLFSYRSMKKEALDNFHKAEKLCDELRLDDCDFAQLRHGGLTRQEARLGLRACGGDLGKAREFIQQRRQRIEQQRLDSYKGKRDRTEVMDVGDSEHTASQTLQPNQATQVCGQLNGTSSSQTTEAADALMLVGARVQPVLAPNPTNVSEADTQERPEDEEALIKEILQRLPANGDSYIDLSLEEEQAVLAQYMTKLIDSETRQ
ncbi:NEDD8 ultimate buster 1 isoform X2 [Callorhinchus milii]|uniref:NEDD8 ultimate buster 1 isoform X2 n=1 Tax=Callorhinchus milii TaxID=7868 RepID=UPI001C3FAB67|nr:NEDD8 ultimate buster 1 isoform X2 [Callorhinchus milii]